MARRGDVLLLKRKLGFGAGENVERFAVLQADRLGTVLDTLVVAPMDDAISVYDSFPGAVRTKGREAGSRGPAVVLVPQLAALGSDRFEPAPVARLEPATMRSIDAVLRLVLDL